MQISLKEATVEDAPLLHAMQVRAFLPLLEKYKDYDTNPANESVTRIVERLQQSATDYYKI